MKTVKILLPRDLAEALKADVAARLPRGASYQEGRPIVDLYRSHLRAERLSRDGAAAHLAVKYYKIATDLAQRLAAPYDRLLDRDEAASLGAEALLEAAHRFDPKRATSVWPLAKLRIGQKIQEAIEKALKRSAGRVSSMEEDEDPLDRIEAPQVDEHSRSALGEIAAWVGAVPGRRATINRAVAGRPLTAADLARLEELRAHLGMPTPEAVGVTEAAAALGRSPKALRKALVKGQVPGVRCGSTWRVFLRAALRGAPAPAAP